MQLTSWRFEVVTCQSSLLYHNSIIVSLRTFQPPLVYLMKSKYLL